MVLYNTTIDQNTNLGTEEADSVANKKVVLEHQKNSETVDADFGLLKSSVDKFIKQRLLSVNFG